MIALDLKKYKIMCTNDKWTAKSPGGNHIVTLSTELENIKDTDIKSEKVFKPKRKYQKEI